MLRHYKDVGLHAQPSEQNVLVLTKSLTPEIQA